MFKNPYVRTIISSRVLIHLGIWVRNFAILLYVTDMTHNDPLYVSLISVVEYAPIFIFAIIGGTFADRSRPRRTMIGSDMLSALSIITVLLVILYGAWHALFFATLISSILSQFSQPSAMKLYKQHVPEEQLQAVMGIYQTLTAVFVVIGPMVGTFIYQQYGLEVALAITAVLFLGAGWILSWLPKDAEDVRQEQKTHFMQDLKDGLHYVWRKRELRALGGAFVFSGFAAGLVQPMLIFVTMENLGLDKGQLKWMMMANGAAMLVGGAVVMGIAKKIKPQTLLALGLAVSTFTTIGLGFSVSVPLSISCQVLGGFFYPFIMIGINTLMIKNTEGAFIGRVGGVMTPLFMGMMVIGMSIAGILKSALSLSAVYLISGCLFFTGMLVLLPLYRKHVQDAVEVPQVVQDSEA
ncbi:MFS transporter [Paenibacillus terrigena]|uniref:MFS transporter n=1 Tax=Paenibacillus terrigena TaxID=369333 RepID=UPI0028D311EE|nr:MFS transporter [Paenibacillus terrigena]